MAFKFWNKPSRQKMTKEEKYIKDIVEKSGLFDAEWYVDHYPDVKSYSGEPLLHYCKHGIYESRDPGPNFKTVIYKLKHPEVMVSQQPALLHAIENNAIFDDLNTLEKVSVGDLLASGGFDAKWYLSAYPDVQQSKLDPIEHYCKHGYFEGRLPLPPIDDDRVSTEKKIESTDVDNDGGNFSKSNKGFSMTDIKVLDGASAVSFSDLLVESGFFNDSWYLKKYKDVARAGVNPFDHFVASGARELRDPGPEFESDFYSKKYPEYKSDGVSPMEHYLRVGRYIGNRPSGPPIYERWVNSYDDILDSDRVDILNDISISKNLNSISLIYFIDKTAFKRIPAIIQAILSGLYENWRILFIPIEIDSASWLGYWQSWDGDPRIAYAISSDQIETLAPADIYAICYGSVIFREHALYQFHIASLKNDVEVIYSDHDSLVDGSRVHPIFKPDYSPEYLSNFPYIGPVAVFCARAFDKINLTDLINGVISQGYNQFSELIPLKWSWADRTQVSHISHVLYHLCDAPIASNNERTNIAVNSESLDDRGLLGRLSSIFRRRDDKDTALPTVSIIIPTRDRVELVRPCIESIFDLTDYPRSKMEIIIVDNDSSDHETIEYFSKFSRLAGCSIVKSPGMFNFSKINNDAVEKSTGEILLFINNDTTVRDKFWLRKIISYCIKKDVGAVGAKLLYGDNSIQHGGTVVGIQGVGAHLSVGDSVDEIVDYTRELSCVTGACLGMRRSVFEEIGGFDPILRIAFNDVKLCLSSLRLGYRNIYIADAIMYHHESKSRGFDDTREKMEQNTREAIYVRREFSEFFKRDPFYSPNLSLHKISDVAFPPRVGYSWRKNRSKKNSVLFLSITHQIGHGVPCVVQLQAEFFASQGWSVSVGGPRANHEFDYAGCNRVYLKNAEEAASYVTESGIDIVIVHTPPFFSIVRWLGSESLVYFFDHGEPNPEFFPDRVPREDVQWEKRFCAPLTKRIFCISETIKNQGFESRSIVLRNGNSHLSSWNNEWKGVRKYLRDKYDLASKFVVLNVCRFEAGERNYKGVDFYVNLMKEFSYLHPNVAKDITFLIAGKAKEADVRAMKSAGLHVFPNISDHEMRELYAISDMYMNFSKWEGYNLGIGQALAMGLPVIASNIEAHREFPIFVSNDTIVIADELAKAFDNSKQDNNERSAIIFPWSEQISRLYKYAENDIRAVN